jgi:transcriptional regulator with XRE-family HTH domain
MSFGENLRLLRRGRDITQDELALALTVAPQTISKWERGESYPDFPLLPPLAVYFGVTLDELVGMAEFRSDGKKKEYTDSISTLMGDWKYDEVIPLIREALTMFPGDSSFMVSLAAALDSVAAHLHAENAPEETTAPYDEEAEKLFLKLLDAPEQRFRQGDWLSRLMKLYRRTNRPDRARLLAERQPNLDASREVLLAQISEDGDEHMPRQDFWETLWRAARAELMRAAQRASTANDGAMLRYILKKDVELAAWLLDDPADSDARVLNLWHTMMWLSQVYALDGETELALSTLEDVTRRVLHVPRRGIGHFGYEDAELVARRAEFESGSPPWMNDGELSHSWTDIKLRSKLVYGYYGGEITTPHPADVIAERLTSADFDALRGDPRFIAITERLEAARG